MDKRTSGKRISTPSILVPSWPDPNRADNNQKDGNGVLGIERIPNCLALSQNAKVICPTAIPIVCIKSEAAHPASFAAFIPNGGNLARHSEQNCELILY